MASVGRDDDDNSLHVDDLGFCARVLNAAEDLPWWRRSLVVRRLRVLFGKNTVDLCFIHGEQAEDPQMAMTLVLQRQARGLFRPDEGLPQPDRGAFDRALRCPPNSKPVADLVRSLTSLSRAF